MKRNNLTIIWLIPFVLFATTTLKAASLACPDFNDVLKVVNQTSAHWNPITINGVEWIYSGSGRMSDFKSWDHIAVIGASKDGGGTIACYATKGDYGPFLESSPIGSPESKCTYNGKYIPGGKVDPHGQVIGWQKFPYTKNIPLICS